LVLPSGGTSRVAADRPPFLIGTRKFNVMNSKDSSAPVTLLSHPLDASTVSYGGSMDVTLEPTRSIQAGDTANTTKITTSTHAGTHVDVPKHFFQDGGDLLSFPPAFWLFRNVFMIEHHVRSDGSVLGLDVLEEKLLRVPFESDMVLIRTDWERHRISGVEVDRERYARAGPGLAAEIGEWLRKHTAVRAVGFDFISLSSFLHRDIGRVAHRSFLEPTAPIVIVEDMHLSELDSAPKWVLVAPLLISGGDGAPTTVFAGVG
jgi:arylformamidase